jgi:hypothetical protein
MSLLTHARIGRVLLLHVAVALIAGPVAPAFAQDCGDVLDQAKEHYTFGRFDEAIRLLSACVDEPGGDPAVLQEAYRVIGMAYVAMSKELEAKQAIRELLDLVPGYEPDPENDRPGYVDLVREVKLESNPSYVPPGTEPAKKGGFLTKALIGAGAAIVGVVLLLGGGEDQPVDNTLPGPPVLPGN